MIGKAKGLIVYSSKDMQTLQISGFLTAKKRREQFLSKQLIINFLECRIILAHVATVRVYCILNMRFTA